MVNKDEYNIDYVTAKWHLASAMVRSQVRLHCRLLVVFSSESTSGCSWLCETANDGG